MMTNPGPDDEAQRVREAAFRLLAVRARSARELLRRLRQKGFATELIEELIADLQAKGYQSDEEFARQYALEKWTSSGWGPARVRQALAEKGIAPDLRDRIIGEVYEETDLPQAVLPLAAKRWRATENLPEATRKRRLIGFLQRRGYNWEVIQSVMAEIERGSGS